MSRLRWLLALSFCLSASLVVGLGPPESISNDPDEKNDAELLRTSKVGLEGLALLEFVRKRTPSEDKHQLIAALIQQMGDEEYEVRARANKALIDLGPVARPQLRQALADRDLEISHRAEQALELIPREEDNLLAAAVLRQLGRTRPDGVVEALLDYLPGIEEVEVIDVLGRVLRKAAVENGRPHPLVLRAAADRSPLKRALAGEVLCWAGSEQRGLVRKLLRDPEGSVRLRVALSLFEARDREAIPALIGQLTAVPREERLLVEDRLVLVAGETAPPDPGSETEEARRGHQLAWERWWKEKGATLDLTRIDLTPRFNNYTLVCWQERTTNGKVQEFDRAGRLRWEINNLRCPVSAQVVAPNRLLVCEYRGAVSERNFKGEILWQKDTSFPLSAQRMANGNTMVFTRSRIEELDRNGKEVFGLNRPGISAGQVDAAGHFHLITGAGQYERIDRTGRVLKSFSIGPFTSLYASFQVLPGGHILVPHYVQSRVAEYDEDGKVVWEASVSRPNSVQRLPGGNTLVGCRMLRRVVEVDRTGKEVRAQMVDGQVLFAQKR
jgi:hypothetical protein